MGGDIDGFRRLLAGYKLTITIALTDANLRKSSLTAESVEGFKDLVQTATDDLQAHLDGINDKLEMVLKRAVPETAADSEELRLMKEERLSAQRCLQICDQLSKHISQIQNYATGDAVQFMVSTNGKVLHGKNQGLGWRTRQVGGYLSDDLVAQLSKDMSNMGYHPPEKDASDRQAKSGSGSEDSEEGGHGSDAWQRHGRGIRLANKRTPELSPPLSAAAAEGQTSSSAACGHDADLPGLRRRVARGSSFALIEDRSPAPESARHFHYENGEADHKSFLGRYIVNRLARRGCNVVVPYREEMTKRHLKPTGDLGRVSFIEFDLRNTASIEESVRHSDIVVNLIGRTYPTKNFSLWDVHVEGTERIAEAVAKYDCDRFIQVSSYNADPKSPAEYFRTKAEGERVARALFPETTIVRPARLFGFEDQLLHRLAGVTNILTVNHLQERFWPVHVIDVGKALEQIAFDDTTAGETFELYGPTNYSMAEIAALVDREIIHQRRHINVPKNILKPIAYWANRLLWWPIISADELEVECLDQHIDKSAKTLADLGIEPADLADLTYHYLQDYRSSSYYDLPPATERERREDKKYLHVIDDQ
ncbi:hypothetical protein DV735_g4744, partial [Chaetothyriales sp. CBS 134920]